MKESGFLSSSVRTVQALPRGGFSVFTTHHGNPKSDASQRPSGVPRYRRFGRDASRLRNRSCQTNDDDKKTQQ
jgi:hypothetical protein